MQSPIGVPATCWNESNVNCTVADKQCNWGCANHSATEIVAMARYDAGIRLFIANEDDSQTCGFPVPACTSNVPVADLARATGWLKPSTMGGRFSATCWFTFRDVYDRLALDQRSRPIGLIEANVGGTPDQHWSSPDALQRCKGPHSWNWPKNFSDSILWNTFIVPLLQTVHSGAIWYQVKTLLFLVQAHWGLLRVVPIDCSAAS